MVPKVQLDVTPARELDASLTLEAILEPVRRRMASRRDSSAAMHSVQLSVFHEGAIGALVGSLEQTIMRPAVYWKTELQQQRFTVARAINPLYCYRGLPVAVACIAPITCIQYSSNSVYSRVLRSFSGNSEDPLGDGQRILCNILAGTTSALVQSPCQLIEVNQQNHGGSMASTAKRVIQTHGVSGLFRGLSMTSMREGIFCSSYMTVAPWLERHLRQRFPTASDGLALAASSIGAGCLGAFCSHPADTLKTRLQGGLFPLPGACPSAPRPSTPWEALRELRRLGGPNTLSLMYMGFLPRCFRIACCVYIYRTFTPVLQDGARSFLT